MPKKEHLSFYQDQAVLSQSSVPTILMVSRYRDRMRQIADRCGA
ncbi:MAG: hypothetical protein ACWGOX_11870 [Desulforhopalus sp.]